MSRPQKPKTYRVTLENGKKVRTRFRPGDKVFFCGEPSLSYYEDFTPPLRHRRLYVVSHLDRDAGSDWKGFAGVHLVGVTCVLSDFNEANVDPSDLITLEEAKANAARVRKFRGPMPKETPRSRPGFRSWFRVDGDEWKDSGEEDGA